MKYRQQLKGLQPYHPGKSADDVKQAYGLQQVIKLASNENPYGCSGKVSQAISHELLNLSNYPDSSASELRKRVAEHLGVFQDQLIFGKGTDEIIHLLCRAYLEPGVNTVMSDFTFLQYKRNAIIEGAHVREIPHLNGRHDIQKMIDAIDDKTNIVWVCNPNNPTGEYVRQDELINLLESIDKSILVVCDEAYFEYVDADDFPDTISLLSDYPNLIVTRTFSKGYGLAALRIGYAVCDPEVVSTLNIVRETFNTSHLSQIGVMAALDDQSFIKECHLKNRQELEQYYRFCWRFGLSYYPSQANFIFIDMNMESNKVAQHLLSKGFIIRPGSTFGKPTGLRITIGTPKQNDSIIALLSHFVKVEANSQNSHMLSQ
ncbi:histidinol-phosphate transaminase [Anaerobacillus alkalidiazotrophicus]|uniref:Histidinol-phosphate aminotransferase n=1 Tax=Anaerobacillus alkalidiazotrophicus TaxID=472963 RepID=A0A1S2MBR1_9BACI|nr:histidinol-phosphate transaminase [Anaerobacillus alkalidiazotrophicus]OIJ21863.1 histidinol-phosphate transaminase [Anaerobacillus alkalidiazotrophicus]